MSTYTVSTESYVKTLETLANKTLSDGSMLRLLKYQLDEASRAKLRKDSFVCKPPTHEVVLELTKSAHYTTHPRASWYVPERAYVDAIKSIRSQEEFDAFAKSLHIIMDGYSKLDGIIGQIKVNVEQPQGTKIL
jgi:hypothetical protein